MGPSDEHVTILLSIHDGEEWLEDLIGSIQAQSHEAWSLVVRDDGSSDGGPDLVRRLGRTDRRIRLVADGLGRLGPAASFMTLLSRVEPGSGYFAFCDQDDLWYPHKLSWSVNALSRAPEFAAVFTDAVVGDAEGRPVGSSALAARGFRGSVDAGRVLITNPAIGATLIGTNALAHASTLAADGESVLMHDWWIALVAAYAGELRVLDAPTMTWRRHEATVTGTTPPTLAGRMRRRREYLDRSVRAARLLDGSAVEAGTESASRAVGSLAGASENVGLADVVRARLAGVRAWPWYRQLGLYAAVSTRRWSRC